MKIFHNIPDNKDLFTSPVVTIGNFDGVHIGHQKILTTLMNRSSCQSGDPVVITFSSHPRKILNPEANIKIISTLAEKVNAIYNFGIDNIVVLNFTREMSNMQAKDFYNEILIKKIDIKEIVIGYDHAFGKNRKGNIKFLEELCDKTNIGLTRVDEEIIDSRPVSSTWLREEIKNGNIQQANKLLGRNYNITGSVVKGESRGKTLGFPTANIIPDDPDKLIPKDGVYAVTLLFDDESDTKKQGMLNIGNNPTFSHGKLSIEVNIFDFDEDIYDNEITIEFHDRIRDEIKFNSSDSLISQMKQDKISVMNLLNNSNG